jgi:hypothetical protein
MFQMDFLDPKKKRAHARRLIIGYCLMAVALLLATTLLLFAALGYGINRTTGEVVQNGLVFVDAHPEAANMRINGQDRGQTDGRFVLEAGNYSLQLSRDGYRAWNKDFVIQGGSIVRLVYPFLFPTQLVTAAVTTNTVAPDVVTESPDRHWIVMHQPNALTTFQVIDTSLKKNVATPIAVPAALFAGHTVQKLEFSEWSTDNKSVLLKAYYEGGYDYIIVDRDKPESSVNISQVMGRTYSTVTLRDKQSDRLYTYDANGGVLQSVELKTKLTTQIATSVVSFWPYKDTNILYVTTTGAPAGKVNVHLRDGQSDYLVRELAAGPKYQLNLAEFDGDMYLTAGSSADGKQYIYKNPLDALKKNDTALNIPLLLLKLDNPDAVTFSANARFIALQSGSKFEVYDAETKQQYRFDTKLPLTPGQKATWMDGHRMMLISEGKMNVFEFDGMNKQTLVNTDQNFIPLFDRDFTAMFTYGVQVGDATKSGLSRTELIVKKTQ